MSATTAPNRIPDREFLDIRSKMIELAALLGRAGRGPGWAAGDPRMDRIARGLQILASGTAGCAEEVQMVFSLPYDEHWR
jgi:hypothetical protein